MLQWLDENEDVSVEFMHGALERDKKDGVRKQKVILICCYICQEGDVFIDIKIVIVVIVTLRLN